MKGGKGRQRAEERVKETGQKCNGGEGLTVR